MAELIAEPGEDSEVVDRVNKARQEGNGAQNKWREEAIECFDFASGHQWSAEDEQYARDEGKPLAAFDRIGTVLAAVSGSESNNRQEVRYKPREVTDSGVNEVLTDAAKWARDQCDAEDEESDAFRDMLICGMGWTETRMDYELDPEGMVVIERIDPLEMRWDPSARKINLTDASWVQRERLMSKEQIDAQWPDKSEDLKPEVSDARDNGATNQVDPRTSYMASSNDSGYYKGKFAVLQHQWFEVVPEYRVMDPLSGQVITMSDEDFKVAKERLDQIMPGGEIKYARTTKRIYKQAFVCGGVELESGPAPCQYGFTLQSMTGKRDRNKGCFFGLVRPMRDPQRWSNRFLMLLLEIIGKNAKGGLVIETGAVDNVRKFEDSWAKTDAISWVKPGGSAKIQPKVPPAIPPQIAALMEFAITSIRDCSGVNVELLGLVDRQQAGVLEAQRTKAGMTILAVFFDAMRHYRKKQGRILAHFINEYIADGRLIRITGPQGEQFVPLLKQDDVMAYDVVVDTAPTSRDSKEQVWGALMQLLPVIMKQGLPLPPEIVDYAPLPAGLIAAWKKTIDDPQKKQMEAQMQMQGQQMQQMGQALQQGQQQLQSLQMQLQAAKAGSEADMVKAKADMLKAETERIKAMAEANAPVHDGSELDAVRLQYEDKWKQLEADTKVLIAQIQAKTSLTTSAMGSESHGLDEEGQPTKKPGIEAVVEAMNMNLAGILQAQQSGNEAITRTIAETMNRPRVAKLSDGREIRVN